MLCLTCTMTSSVDLAHYAVSLAKDRVSVDSGTMKFINFMRYFAHHWPLDDSELI